MYLVVFERKLHNHNICIAFCAWRKAKGINIIMKSKKLLLITSLVTCVCIIVTVMIISTTGSISAKVSKQLELGNKYLSEGNYKEAILAFEKAIEIGPLDIEDRMGLSDVYIKT